MGQEGKVENCGLEPWQKKELVEENYSVIYAREWTTQV